MTTACRSSNHARHLKGTPNASHTSGAPYTRRSSQMASLRSRLPAKTSTLDASHRGLQSAPTVWRLGHTTRLLAQHHSTQPAKRTAMGDHPMSDLKITAHWSLDCESSTRATGFMCRTADGLTTITCDTCNASVRITDHEIDVHPTLDYESLMIAHHHQCAHNFRSKLGRRWKPPCPPMTPIQ